VPRPLPSILRLGCGKQPDRSPGRTLGRQDHRVPDSLRPRHEKDPYLSNRGQTSGTGKTYEVINNLIYNCMRNDGESFNDDNNVNVNLVGNCYKVGPSASLAGVPWMHCGSRPVPTMYAHVSRNHHVTIPGAYNIAKAFIDSATVKGFTAAFIEPRKTPDSMIVDGKAVLLSVSASAGPFPAIQRIAG